MKRALAMLYMLFGCGNFFFFFFFFCFSFHPPKAYAFQHTIYQNIVVVSIKVGEASVIFFVGVVSDAFFDVVSNVVSSAISNAVSSSLSKSSSRKKLGNSRPF